MIDLNGVKKDLQKEISIIIVNYKSAELVKACVASIMEKVDTSAIEIIIVDNASNDGSADILRNEFKDSIRIIESEVNLGFGKANNLGAAYAAGEYLFLLNPDTILLNNAPGILRDYLQTHPQVGVAGGMLYGADMSMSTSYCEAFDTLKNEQKSASWANLVGSKLLTKLCGFVCRCPREEHESLLTEKEVAYIIGADMMLRKSLFDEVGGFDPDFFMYYEEEELTWRIREKGYGVVCVPQARIVHLDGATTSKEHTFSEKQFRFRMHGALTYYKKRFGDTGAAEFFRLRTLRYDRLMKIAKIQGKLTEDFPPAIQKKCLEEEYRAFLNT